MMFRILDQAKQASVVQSSFVPELSEYQQFHQSRSNLH